PAGASTRSRSKRSAPACSRSRCPPAASSCPCASTVRARDLPRSVSEKRYYMACLDLEGRSCLVVGGGSVGLAKAQTLLDCGARVTVVAPQALTKLAALPVEWLRRSYRPSDLDGRFLVVAATGSGSVNGAVAAD